jgi:bacterioferritin-associated ferredoxin
MIVCQCKKVTEDAVRRTVRAGARTVGEIGFVCLAGTECGACHETLEQILQSERGEQERADESAQSGPSSWR